MVWVLPRDCRLDWLIWLAGSVGILFSLECLWCLSSAVFLCRADHRAVLVCRLADAVQSLAKHALCADGLGLSNERSCHAAKPTAFLGALPVAVLFWSNWRHPCRPRP